jgi:hypothetical protein
METEKAKGFLGRAQQKYWEPPLRRRQQPAVSGPGPDQISFPA